MTSSDPQSFHPDHLATAAFLCGWACADEAHVSSLPETLVNCLGLAFVELKVARNSQQIIRHHVYPMSELQTFDGRKPCFSFAGPLDKELTLSLSALAAESRALSSQQMSLLRHIADLAHKSLECVLVRQHDCLELGSPFGLLTEREWQVCRALEGHQSERSIALKLKCSPHTLHAHVKSVYLKLGVKGRKQAVDLLANARRKCRKRALRGLRSNDRGAVDAS